MCVCAFFSFDIECIDRSMEDTHTQDIYRLIVETLVVGSDFGGFVSENATLPNIV